MVRVKVKIKTPSKSQIKRDVNRAIRKNLICPSCGHKLPTTYASRTKCSRCGQVISINI